MGPTRESGAYYELQIISNIIKIPNILRYCYMGAIRLGRPVQEHFLS